ncbi:unnamed protein product [Heligmosomoides polygyrus]|uniref:HTH_48 domain-containing protein n=1 Tax=Heligmosomoides polygyrus TaxID=6339 RepID=A0A183FCJ6_HELPZ|nr:unnamed protein product [Heligmosomoides polygyrus]
MNIDRMEINYDVPVEQRDHQEQVPVSPLQLSKGNIRNKFLFLWHSWYLFLQSKGNTKNGLLLLRCDKCNVQQTIKHLVAIVLEYKYNVTNSIARTITTSLGYTLTEVTICKPRHKPCEKSCTSSHIELSKILTRWMKRCSAPSVRPKPVTIPTLAQLWSVAMNGSL